MTTATTTIDLSRGTYRRIYSGAIRGRRINRLDPVSEMVFWRAHMIADDFGRFIATPDLFVAEALPLRPMDQETARGHIEALARVGLIDLYERDGERYGCIHDFEAMQPAGRNGRRAQKHPGPERSTASETESSSTLQSDAATRSSVASENQPPGTTSSKSPSTKHLQSGGIRGNPGNPENPGEPGNSCNSTRHQYQDQDQDQDQDQREESASALSPPSGASTASAASKKSVKSKPELTWSRDGGWQGITDEDRATWAEAYPACDLDRQLASMTAWLQANPAKARRTQWRRFVTNWLSRSQNSGGDVPSRRPGGPRERTRREPGLGL